MKTTYKQTLPAFFLTIIWLILPNHSIAADYITTLNNELSAIGLNNGNWLYNSETDNNWQNKISYNNQCNPCSKIATSGNLTYFNSAYRVNAQFLQTARPWDGIIKVSATNLTVGDKLLLVFGTKGDPSANVNSGALQAFLKSPAKSLAFIPMSNNWEQWRIPFEASTSTIGIELRFGFLSQQFEIGGIALIKYNNSTNIEVARIDASQSYTGMQAGASWRTEALNRLPHHLQ